MRLKRFFGVFGLLFGAGVLFKIVVLGLHFFQALSYPFAIDYGEPFVLEASRRFFSGIPIYLPQIKSSSDLVTFYPPIYYALFGFLEGELGGGFFWGRVISITGAVGASLMVYLIATTLGGKKWIALLCAIVFLSSKPLYDNAIVTRIDALAALFTFLGLWLAIRFAGKPQFWFSFLFFLLALYTRHSLVAAPAAVIFSLFLRNQKKGLLAAFVFSVPAILVFFFMNQATQGGFGKTLWSLQAALPKFWSLTPLRYVTCLRALTVAFLVMIAWIGRSFLRKETSSFLFYAFFSFVVSLSIVKAGSDANYLIEVAGSSCIVLSLLLTFLAGKIEKQVFAGMILMAVFLIMPFKPPVINDLKEMLPLKQRVAEEIRSTSGEVFMEIPDLIVIYRWKQPLYETFMLKNLKSVFYEEISEKVRNRRFDRLVLTSPAFSMEAYRAEQRRLGGSAAGFLTRYTPELVRSIEENYELIEDLSRKDLYVLRVKPLILPSRQYSLQMRLASTTGPRGKRSRAVVYTTALLVNQHF